MSQDKGKILELSELELRQLLDLGARELVRQINHGCADPVLASLVKKGADALAPEAKEDAKEKRSL